MSRAPSASNSPIPRWLVAVGSAAIVVHLAAVVIPILDMPSGPWSNSEGVSLEDAPGFAHSASGLTTVHADYFRVAHSYHFISNRPADIPGVRFEVRLKNDQGEVIETLHFPDPNANPWVRHRQEVLANALAPDLPIQQQGGEVIPAAGENPTVFLWALPGEDFSGMKPPPPPTDRNVPLHLQAVPQHRVPRYRMAMRPSEWALILARSYTRYLCRTHGAASGEIIRHTRESVSPAVLFGNDTPPANFNDLEASFGDMSK
jgi:hypothetical protein